MTARTTITSLAVVLVLVACATPERVASNPGTKESPSANTSARRTDTSDAGLLLSYFETLQKLSNDDAKAELATLKARESIAASPFVRLQMAMLLGTANGDVRNVQQALKLTSDALRDPQLSDNSLRNLALLLESQLMLGERQEESIRGLSQRLKDERRRAEQTQAKQEEALQQANQKLKEEQKQREELKRAESAQNKQEESVQVLVQKLKEEQKRADELQQKLDAIMKIEKSLMERQQPPPAPPKEPPKQ